MQTPVQPFLVDRLAVGPDPTHTGHLTFAKGDGETDRIGVLADRRTRASLSATAVLLHPLPKAAGPDDLPGDAKPAEDARKPGSLGRAHDAQALDATGLDRCRSGAHQLLVDDRPERRPDRLADRQPRETEDRAAHSPSDGRSGSRQYQRGHQPLLPAKRKAPAIRRCQDGVSGDSTTPCPE